MEANNIGSNAIVAEVLKGEENYANWRACIRSYLWVRDLWDVVEETAEPSKQDGAWRKRNVSALHAIQISCAPTMLSYIRDHITAKDAWNTLADKCQPRPVSVEGELTQPVAEVADRTVILDFLKSIKENDLKTTNHLLKVNPQVKNAQIFQRTGRTPLHFAVTMGNLEMVNELLSKMSEEDVKMQDFMGRTALHYAAFSPGNIKITGSLIRKNKELLTIPDKRGHIPLTDACVAGHKDMTQYLYNKTTRAYLLLPENQDCASMIVAYCVICKLFDVALDLLRLCPQLANSIYFDGAVLSLSGQPSAFLSSSGLSFWLRVIYYCLKAKKSAAFSSDGDVGINMGDQQDQKENTNFMTHVEAKLHGLWLNLLKLFGIKQMYELTLTHLHAKELLLLLSKMIAGLNAEQIRRKRLDMTIIQACQQGTTEFLVEIIKANPDLLTIYDDNIRNIYKIAVVYRQEKVFSLIYGHEAMKYDFPIFNDKYGNNMLHLAGQIEPESLFKLHQISGAALQMQRELQWFKEVESIVPPGYKYHKNTNGETPYEVFDRSHANLVKNGEQWMKDIAQSSTIVGTLIITIMFATLFTVPGGNNQDTGFPLFLTRRLFKIFIFSDAISLSAPSTSVLVFVGILTSRYSKDDFLTSLPKRLIIGLLALFISFVTMMVAFCSTVIMMVKGQLKIVIPIVVLAVIPVCIFAWLQFPLLVRITISTYGPGIFDKKMKKWL